MLAATQKFRDFLRTSHIRRLKITLFGDQPGATPDTNYGEFQITRGNIDSDLTQFVSRTLSASIALDPYGPLTKLDDQFTVVQNGYLVVEIGLEYPDSPGNPEYIQIAKLRVTRFQPSESLATTNIEAMDRTVMLRGYPIFITEITDNGYQAKLTAGWNWMDCIDALVTQAMPGEIVIRDPLLVAKNMDPKTNMANSERDTFIQSLCEANGAWLRCDFDGRFHLSPRPVAMTQAQWNANPGWKIQHGQMGVLVESNDDYSRENIFNAVWVEWQAPDPTGAVTYVKGMEMDLTPTSPTYWNGPFGRHVKVVQDVPVFSDAQAHAKALQLLGESLGRYFTIDITCLANPLLELGDTIEVTAMNMAPHLRVIERITLPLGPDATMNIGTRLATT